MNKEIKKTVMMGLSVIAVSFVASMAMAQSNSDTSREAMREAFAQCAESVGLPKPEAGQRPQAPDEEQRAKMDACLKEKGFTPPSHFGGGHRPPPPGDQQGGGAVQ